MRSPLEYDSFRFNTEVEADGCSFREDGPCRFSLRMLPFGDGIPFR